MSASALRRTALGLAVTLVISLVSVSALALDKDGILALHAAGLDESTIVNVIRNDTLDLTADDVDELEAAGLPSRVIAELRLQMGLDDDGGPTDSEQLQRDLAEQQRLEQERLRLEQERLEAEREQLRGELEAERDQQSAVDSGFRGLRQARLLSAEGNYMSAAAVFNRFLEEVMPMPGSDEYYQAKFGLVDALYQAGFRSSIRADALEVALMGSGWNHFDDAVRILRGIVRDTGFNSPRIADLANEITDNFPQDFQDEFNYFLGRYYYDAGDYDTALLFLGQIADGVFSARAAFLSGVIYINPERAQNVEAVAMLQRAAASARADVVEDQDVLENSYLALARILYQIGDFGGALYYYQKVPVESPRRTTALFESGWALFLSGDINRAIGNFHSLQSPYHNHRFYPDLFVLEAAGYLFNCNIDEAHEAIAQFEDHIGGLRDSLDQVLSTISNPQAFYDAMVDPEGAAQRGDAELPLEAIQVVLADADFHSLYGIVRQLERERDLLVAEASSMGVRGQEGVVALESEIASKRIALGLHIHDVVNSLSQELDDWWFRAQEVEIEITDLEAQYLTTVLSVGTNAFNEGTTLFVLADDWQFWPWEGEYWLDEVGNYRANLNERCPDDVEF